MMEKSISLIREEFVRRLERDSFTDLVRGVGPDSVHEFIDYLTAGNVMLRKLGLGDNAQFPDLTDLNITFGELLRLSVRTNRGSIPIATILRDLFCLRVAAGLPRHVASNPGPFASQAALTEVGASTWGEWADAMGRPELVQTVAQALCDAVGEAFANRTLLSFFVRPPAPGKFSMWGPYASSGEGRRLPTRAIDGDGYSVSVDVSRYEEAECGVTAYEWQATLTMSGASEPDAAACGMVYVFEREGGRLAADLDDLIIASDSMADSDVIQVKAFITQHGDAADLIEKSDLCFVWLWERRHGADKGLGAKCLVPALQDLKRRFKKVRTVVFDARPGQFSNWTSHVDPPMVAMEKQTAVENLVSYIQGLKLDFDVRPIFARSDDPFKESLVALGEAMQPHDDADDERGPERRDVENGGIDLDEWADEIGMLLRSAGLEELAEEFDEGDAAYDDVVAAIKHIVFDSRVHYLRPSSTSGFDPEYLEMEEEIPHAEAHEAIDGMDEFCAGLPDYMKVMAVHWLGQYAICTVVADTPFGNLTEYFTLVRKPRPINIENFFRSIT